MSGETATTSIGGFTMGEIKMLVECLKCLKGDPTSMIDFEQVAANMGFKGAKSARDRFGNIKRAKFPNAAASSATGDGVEKSPLSKKSPPLTKKSPAKRQKAADQKDGGSPPKKARKAKSPKLVEEKDDMEDAIEGGPVKAAVEADANELADGEEAAAEEVAV